MITDEQQWNRLKNEFHHQSISFLNHLQTLSINDLSNSESMKTLIASRFEVVDSFLHVFRFIDDANMVRLRSILKDLAHNDETNPPPAE